MSIGGEMMSAWKVSPISPLEIMMLWPVWNAEFPRQVRESWICPGCGCGLCRALGVAPSAQFHVLSSGEICGEYEFAGFCCCTYEDSHG